MINVFNQIRQDCVQKLEGYQKMFAEVSKEKRQLEAHLAKLELKESEQRVASTQEKTEYKSARSTIEFLEKALKEKNEKIAELQRQKNVQLWEREKERVLADSQKKMEVLEGQVVDLRRQNASLQKKYSMVDDQYKRLRLKSELTGGPLMPAVNKSEDELKRQIYLLEKDLTALEQELYNQQRTFSTVLCGIKTDLYIVGETLTDPDTGQIPFKDFVRLNSMVDSLATAMAEGDIESARSSLPPHYTYLPSDFKVKRVKRVSNVSRFKLPPMRGISSRHLVGKRGNNENGGEFDEYEGPIEENPELVNRETNVINFINCMKHFPHLSVDFIKEHWAKFKEFDVNGDCSLDFSEVVRALTSMGLQFTAQQAEEAMKEADVNRSRSLDFYEYVLVADKLVSRSGRSELFHSSVANQDRRVVARTCTVQ
ncbi:uncharacterized protein LOC112555643 [Pomacea canaliculata]|uniref:uncharacterized protein LOC112555643 n=1 Tax=Pomacea canaliculata TaxID=400727 RepID=UPI000D7294C2|nr:uncharacterized protein LOC112555643 [Pomacea canaliculata]